MGGSKKTQSVKYVGPSPEQLNAQYQAQQQQLAAQQAMFTTQYQQQIQDLQGAYDNSLSLLTRQMQERQTAQDGLLGQLNTQLLAAQTEITNSKGLYQSLLDRQSQQSIFADAEASKAATLAGQARTDNVNGASALLKLLGQRRQASQEVTRNRGSTGSYAQAGVNVGSLLR